MLIQFTKMHGLGNDFVIIDSRNNEVKLTHSQIVQICNRNSGVGCDQLILIKKSSTSNCEMLIFNPDGSISGACGNATRCVAKLLGLNDGTISVGDRVLSVKKNGDDYTVNMGAVINTSDINFPEETFLQKGYAASIGNPHLVFFVDSFEGLDLAALGTKFEHHPMFPERTNVSFAKVLDNNTIELHVWERGAGLTLACGSAACVVAFIAEKLGKTGKNITIKLPGGKLSISLMEDSVLMTGAAQVSFTGQVEI